MGKRSDVSIPQRREVVLMLVRREEPAAKLPGPELRCRAGHSLEIIPGV